MTQAEWNLVRKSADFRYGVDDLVCVTKRGVPIYLHPTQVGDYLLYCGERERPLRIVVGSAVARRFKLTGKVK